MQELAVYSKFWKDFFTCNLYFALLIWIEQSRRTIKESDDFFDEEA